MSESRSHHDVETPSAWVCRWAEHIPSGGRVLDLACGNGRHARWLAARGHRVEAVDRDAALAAELDTVPVVTTRCADLESDPWPYAEQTFAGIVVVNYLHRPLFPHLLAAIAPGGVPNFLLRHGELLEVVRGSLRVLGYEDICVSDPRPAMVQRVCAVR
ncbi:MAG: putative SAM-dependent methyltransferase [Burkholderiales bacterium]|nr:putative SAM-dependent methyltransferase [Burkholderiales bacterium]